MVRIKKQVRKNQKKVNNIIDFLMEYESVFRFSRNRLIFPENLVSHIGMVTILGTYIMDAINDDWVSDNPDARYLDPMFSDHDYGDFLKFAVVHDMDEIVTGDIARPTKYANGVVLRSLKSLEEQSVERIVKDYNLPEGWDYRWHVAKEGKAGYVLKVSDFLCVIATCYREINLYGNKQFSKVAAEACDFGIELVNNLQEIERNTESIRRDVIYILQKLPEFVLSGMKLIDRRIM